MQERTQLRLASSVRGLMVRACLAGSEPAAPDELMGGILSFRSGICKAQTTNTKD